MHERIAQFLACDRLARVLFIEQEIRTKTDPAVRAYVGMFWGTVYNLYGEPND